MTKFDRSKFKGSKLTSLKETRKEAESKSYSGGGGRPSFLKIEDGVNIFRIAPPHDSESPSIQPIRTTYLEVEVPKYEDNKEVEGETEIKKKRVFIATVHGKDMNKDVVETYIDFVRKKAYDEIQDKDERAKYLYPITGWRAAGKWNPGINPSTNYIAYAWDSSGVLGRLEMYPTIIKKMEELNAAEAADEPIEVDIFSDPDDGVSLVIEKVRENNKWNYIISKREYDFNKYLKKYKDKDIALEKYEEARNSEVVSDDQLKDWMEKESLKDLYVGVYTQRDFNFAIDGLKRFDDENEYGIFEEDEFLDLVEAIQETVPEDPKQEKKDSDNGKDIEETFSKKTDKKPKEVESEEIDYSEWSKIKMKKKITAYMLEYYEGEELPDLDIETMREWCVLVDKEDELPLESAGDEKEESEKESVEEKEETEEIPSTTRDRIAALKAKAAASKK